MSRTASSVRMALHEPSPDVLSGAALSACGAYRYHLVRGWGRGSGCVVFVMLNPSTADGAADDPTIRKCAGFARRRGAASLSVVNLYAYRATKPAELCRAARDGRDIVGPDNDAFIQRAMGRVGVSDVVFAWGALSAQRPPGMRDRVQQVIELAQYVRQRPVCLARSNDGDPRHPLMLGYDAATWSAWP